MVQCPIQKMLKDSEWIDGTDGRSSDQVGGRRRRREGEREGEGEGEGEGEEEEEGEDEDQEEGVGTSSVSLLAIGRVTRVRDAFLSMAEWEELGLT